MRWLVIIILMLCSVPFFGQALAAEHLSYYQSATDDSLSTEELLERADKHIFSDPKMAMSYAERALSLSKNNNDKKGEVKSYYLLGELKIRQGDVSTAKPSFEQGLSYARELADKLLIAQGLYHLSFTSERVSKFTSALDYLKQSLALYQELGLRKNVAKCYSSFGRIYQKLGSYDLALENLFLSLRINEELDSKSGLAVVKTNIGNVYLKTSEYEDARNFFLEALTIDRENDDPVGILISTLNVGVSEQKMGNYEEALNHYKEALESAKELNYRYDEALLLGNIGSTLRQQGNLEQSLTYLLSSLELSKEINRNFSHTLNDIAETYLALNSPLSSVAYSRQAIESSREKEDLDQLRYAYLNLSKAYEMQGDFERAYMARVRYDSLKDSLFSIEKARKMDELEVLYETEKNEQEIEMLTLEKETAEFRRSAYLISGILGISILWLLYMGQRYKSKKNRQLLEKEQEVAQMKSNFFSNISHEFRTPLTLISGPIETMKAEFKEGKMRGQLDIMEKNADRLLSLINQLLDLSKLESGKLELSPSTTDIVTLVKGVTMTFQSLAEMKEIDLTIKSEIKFFELEIDREKIETILINLINNAFTYTSEGGKVTVSLGIGKDHQGHDVCQISVKDTGKGISGQEIPHVFDRFYRGVDSEMEQTEGTGIGLALTKELVELHGGSIEVSSKEHEWTEFVVKLPVESGDYSKESRLVTKVTDSAPPVDIETDEVVQSGKSEEPKINEDSVPILLLIEDNKDVMHYLKDILGDTYRVVKATDGEQGVASAFEHIPDLIISDVMMPKMDGYQVAETLKQDEKTSHIPLILLTAKADQEDKMQGLKAHADEYLTKPFRPKELRLRIQNIIESRKQLREKYKREFMMRPDEISVHSMDDAFLLRVKKAVDEHIDDEDFTVEQLGKEVGMSRSQIHRKLVALTDQSATEFIRSCRLHRAKDMLLQEAGSISEIAYSVGFGSPSYFSKCFRKEFDVSPSEARDNHS